MAPGKSRGSDRPEASTSGLLAWPGTSEMGLGRKDDSGGAVPGGNVSRWDSGRRSLPTLIPG